MIEPLQLVARPVRAPRLEVERVRARIAAKLYGIEGARSRIGPYEILDRIGSGAQGDVYLVRDRRLRRRLAIKVLRGDVDLDGTVEARTLARIVHPNVVPILDIGVLAGSADEGPHTYLVMEYVVGRSLDAWCAENPRWNERLRVLVDAGRGLVAAHAAGIVHGDFKPANVRVGVDGRPRVVDFGLARWLTTHVTVGDEASGSAGGTPGYRAPECDTGRSDARSDQYSFCATAWKLLVELPTSPPPRRRELSRAKKILRRGLQARPDARWPGMPALLAQLEAIAHQRRVWPRIVVAMGIVAIAGYGVGGTPAAEESHGSGAVDTIDLRGIEAQVLLRRGMAAWRDGRASDAREDFERATHLASASGDDRTTAEAAVALVDLLGRRLASYDEARRWEPHARAAIARLGDADLEARLDLRWGAIIGLAGDPSAGREVLHALLERIEHGSSSMPSVAPVDVHSELARLETHAGRSREALEWAQRAVAGEALRVGTEHEDFADALVRLGAAQEQRGDLEGARASLERALAIVERSGEEARALGIHNSLAVVLEQQGDLDAAERGYAQVLLLATEWGLHDAVAATRTNLGWLELARNDAAAALEHFAIARTSAEDVYPPGHRVFVSIHRGLGIAHERRGDPQQAVASHERALDHATTLAMSTAEIGEYRWALGRARWELADPGARTRGRAEVEQGHREMSSDASAHADEIAEADAWLEAHPEPRRAPAGPRVQP